jgi:hypothetical protein
MPEIKLIKNRHISIRSTSSDSSGYDSDVKFITNKVKNVKLNPTVSEEELRDFDYGKILKGKFYCEKGFNGNSKSKTKMLQIAIRPSAIKAAGDGAYAHSFIPKGAYGVYRGQIKDADNANMPYSWQIMSYNKKTGESDDKEILHYVDASSLKHSNWTRFVNCGMTSKDNNMEAEQRFDKFYYIALRDIYPGEELFIDYGLPYRKYNLKLKGKY